MLTEKEIYRKYVDTYIHTYINAKKITTEKRMWLRQSVDWSWERLS